MRAAVCVLSVSVALVGCNLKGDPSKDAVPSASGASDVSGPSSAAGVVNAQNTPKGAGNAWSSSGGTAKGAAPAAAGGDALFASLQGRPQKPDTKPSETVRDAGGVFLGLPAGWTTDDTNKIDPTLGYGANLGGCLMFRPSKNTAAGRTDQRPRLCAVTLDALPPLAGRTAASLELYSFYMSIDKVQWTPWTDGTVGDGLKAKLSKGTYGSNEAFAAYVELSGKKNIFVMGRWANDEEKDQVFDVVRGLSTCTFTPDKRKCTPDKPY